MPQWRPHLRRRVDGEDKLGLFPVVDGEALHQQGAEAGAGAAAERVEKEEALQALALVRHLANLLQRGVYQLFACGRRQSWIDSQKLIAGKLI